MIAAIMPISEMLDTLGIAVCAFDDEDRALLWNRSFLRFFPEHEGKVHAGEPYADNLRRFYLGRLDAAELPHIDRYIADGIARHRRQSLPFEFQHRGQWLRVASLPVPGVGRVRIWSPIPPPGDGGVLASSMASGGKEVALDSVDDIADGLMVRDRQGTIQRVNRRFAAIYRLDSRIQAVGGSFSDLLVQLWAGQVGVEEALLTIADNARFAGAPFELPLPGDRWVRVSEHRALDGSGVSTHVDITDLHRLQRTTKAAQDRAEALAASLRAEIEERRRAEAALQQALRMEAMGQLTGGVAHDFNNLLSVILSNVDLLEADAQAGWNKSEFEVIRAAVERGAALTGQLLAFSRRQPLAPRPVTLAAVVADMLPLLRSASGGRVEIALDIPADLPPALVDPTQFELVVLNLAINARDAMPKGGRLRISAAVERVAASDEPEAPAAGEYVVLSVADTGTGMTEAVKARAVEPFFTTKAPGRGSGLGLSQAYGVARQSGGTMRIDSAPGRGTTVQLLLPAVADGQGKAPDAHPAPRPAEGHHVLLVDDEPVVLASFAEILRRIGHQVSAFPSGREALAALEAGLQIDVLATDVRMPDLTGPELAKLVRERLPGLPVMFISGFTAPEAVEGFPAPSLLLRKPCRLGDLRAGIAAVLAEAERG